MITHHPSLLRPPVLTLRAGALGWRPTSPAFLSTTVSAPPPPPLLRLRPLRAAADGASPISGDGGKRVVPPPSLQAALLGFVRSNFLPLASTWLHRTNPANQGAWRSIRSLACWTLRTTYMFDIASFCQTCLILTITMHFTGLAMFCCMPTTLSSGVTLTQLVGGNSALALAMTVLSNLLGIITVPLSLAKYIGAGAGVSLPTEQLFRSMVTRLLIPLIIGKVARETSKGIADFVDRHRQGFSIASAVLLSLVCL
nr:unnamed protein product [Digitaria exilis]